MTKSHKILVEGSWSFPIDMLRYDQLFPRGSEDSYYIMESFLPDAQTKKPYRIELLGLKHHSYWKPTEERWRSFGWKVVEHKIL